MSADVDKLNVTLERYKLYKLNQKSGQRFDDFLLDVTNQVDKCDFQSMRDEIILYKIVGGIKDDLIRNSLLAERNLKYDQAVDICRASSIKRKEKLLGKENDFEGSAVKKEMNVADDAFLFEKENDSEDGLVKQKGLGSKKVPSDCKRPRTRSTKDYQGVDPKESAVEEFLLENVHKPQAAKKSEKIKKPKKSAIEYYFEDDNMIIELSGSEGNDSSDDNGENEQLDEESGWMFDEIEIDTKDKILSEAKMRAAQKNSEVGETPKEPKRVGTLEIVKFTCDYCGKHFAYEHNLLSHIDVHHPDCVESEEPSEIYVCEICDYSTPQKEELIRHRNKHKAEKVLSCDQCDYKCRAPRWMKAHMAKHGETLFYGCTICPKRFVTRKALGKHEETHMTPEERLQLREQLFEDHNCEECGKTFSSKHALKVHAFRHTGEKPFECLECGFRTVTNGALNSHIVSIHSDEKPFVCSICGRSFKHKFKLQQHSKTHSGVRPHACDICGRRFLQASHVKRHMMVHTGDKPHVCTVCGHRWTTRDNLKAHMRVHEKDTSVQRPARKQKKKPTVIVVTGSDMSDEAEYSDSEYKEADAIIRWSTTNT